MLFYTKLPAHMQPTPPVRPVARDGRKGGRK